MRKLGGILMGIGILVALGAIGTNDYESVRFVITSHSFLQSVGMTAVGIVLLAIGEIIFLKGEEILG
jgi:hypothetical protein